MPLRSSFRPRPPGPSTVGTVQVWVGARRGPWRWLLGVLLVGAGLAGGLLLLGLSFRLGLRLMLNPEALPQGWAQLQRPLNLAPAASLTDLRQQAAAAQQRLGDPLYLEGTNAAAAKLLLVPVLTNSGAVASLALFQSDGGGHGDGDGWRSLATLDVASLSKDTVMAPLRHSSQDSTAMPATFALARVVPLPAAPVATDGTWLTLEGTWQQQGLTLRYGQLLHVDAQNQRLTLLEPWSSPANHPPQWADLDGDGPSDLIIDETVGLEPALRGLQVFSGGRSGATPRVQSVSWVRMPVDAGGQAGAYQQALRLARGGLWSEAQTRFGNLKTALGQGWNPAAEAQLRLMERHAAITHQQAEQDWSTPTQSILALLIDGRWEAALTRLETSPRLVPAMTTRLGADRGQMWRRISAAAALPDPEPAVYVWGGLALKALQNQSTYVDGATQDWLDRQPVPAAARQRLMAMLTAATAPVDSLFEASDGQTVASKQAAAGRDQSGGAIALVPAEAFIGQATPIPTPTAGYAAPGQSLDASLGQWYAVELRAVRQPQGWGRLGLAANVAPAALWPVVQPAAQASPQILRWVSPTTGLPAPLTVRGLSLTDGTPTLLATGPGVRPSSLPPLVFSEGALMWLDASQRQRPDGTAIAAPLATALFAGQVAPPGFEEALNSLAQQSLDLTGDGQPERVLTWDGDALAQLKSLGIQVEATAPKVIILNSDNRVIYSDVFLPQTLMALTTPQDGLPVGLVVHRPGGYSLLAWSATAQRFE